jgi:hypothetical protein
MAGFKIKFVRHKKHFNRSSMWNMIHVTSMVFFEWGIVGDQTISTGTRTTKTDDYACLSNDSSAIQESYLSYYCMCNLGFRGNPYITDGCSRDNGNFTYL